MKLALYSWLSPEPPPFPGYLARRSKEGTPPVICRSICIYVCPGHSTLTPLVWSGLQASGVTKCPWCFCARCEWVSVNTIWVPSRCSSLYPIPPFPLASYPILIGIPPILLPASLTLSGLSQCLQDGVGMLRAQNRTGKVPGSHGLKRPLACPSSQCFMPGCPF